MDYKNDFSGLKYFIEQYIKNINGGGTFTLVELIDLFVESENENEIIKLKKDAQYIKNVLLKEDYEIEKNTLDYILKHLGRKRGKEIVNQILDRLSDKV